MSLWISSNERKFRRLMRPLKAKFNGPTQIIAMIICDHDAQCDETAQHLRQTGFDHIVVISAKKPGDLDQSDLWINATPLRLEGRADVLNAAFHTFKGHWFHYCFNHEKLYFPHFEKRPLRAFIEFTEKCERPVVQAAVVDCFAENGKLYADYGSYHSEPRMLLYNSESQLPKVKQFYGGLRARFSEHVREQRIDRPALIKLTRRLRFFPSGAFSHVWAQGYANPRGPAPVATILSQRVALGLRHNQVVTSSAHLACESSTDITPTTQTFIQWGVMSTGQWV